LLGHSGKKKFLKKQHKNINNKIPEILFLYNVSVSGYNYLELKNLEK